MPFTSAIVLAAGKGTRMNVPYPKVLSDLKGQPLIHWVLKQVNGANLDELIVVVGYEADLVTKALDADHSSAKIAKQEDQLGTGHAVQIGLERVSEKSETVFVTYGDMPFTSANTLRQLVAKQQETNAAVVITTVVLDDPMALAFGRVVRDGHGKIQKIVEQKVCTPEQLKIKECNAGPVAYDTQWLRQNIHLLQKSAVGEYYLTDLAELAASGGRAVESITVQDTKEMHGINTVEHLQQAENLV